MKLKNSSLGEAIARENVSSVREVLRPLGLVVAEVDRDLRYVWIDNPHPDFDSAAVIGKRDDELIAKNDAAEIMALKQSVLSRGVPTSQVLTFVRSDATYDYIFSAVPVKDATGMVVGVITAASVSLVHQ